MVTMNIFGQNLLKVVKWPFFQCKILLFLPPELKLKYRIAKYSSCLNAVAMVTKSIFHIFLTGKVMSYCDTFKI